MTKTPPTDATRWSKAARRASIGDRIARGIHLFVLTLGAAAFMAPLYIMIATSLKSEAEAQQTKGYTWPASPTLENFGLVLSNENAPFGLFLWNTILIAVLSTAGVLLSSAIVAYPFARLRFRGRDRLFILLLATMMLPGVVTMIPTFFLYKQLGWVDTIKPLVIPAWFGGGAFNIFLMRQFFMGLPRELDEAAILDGASHAVIFWRVIMPLSGAALATVGIFTFIYNWKDFMGPLLYLNAPEKQTLELGLRTYQSLNAEKWHLLMAGSVLVMIPLVVIFLLGQRYFVRGIALSGGK